MWTFPKLEKPSVFIAAPGDVQYLRKAATSEIQLLRASAVDGDQLAIYDWTVDKSQSGFDAWIPAQGQIPLPADPNCKAVICAFGARIGTPLPAEFPIGELGSYATRISTRGHRILSPWRAGAETEGCFPLTGSVFEYLAALAVGEKENATAPPVLLMFVGDDSIAADMDLLDANWGGQRLAEEARSRFRPSELRAWERDHYLPQVAQLRNFYRFVADCGIVPKIVANEDQAKEKIRTFLRTNLNVRLRQAVDQPFKGLGSYEIEDLDVFFGREVERAAGIAELRRALADPGRPNSLCILGASGSGKSSFLKAGLVSYLSSSSLVGEYRGIVTTPNDLKKSEANASEAATSRLTRLLTLVLQSISPDVDVTVVDPTLRETRPEFVISKAVQLIAQELAKWRPEAGMLIGLDQFEELVDEWADRATRESWRLVVEFLVAAAGHPHISVLYTLQTNRAELIGNDPVLGEFLARGGSLLLGFPRQSIGSIIEAPFRAVEMELEPALVREFEERITRFLHTGDPDSHSSLLPLISMTLQRLYRRSTNRKRLTLAEFGPLLDIGAAIAAQAAEALTEAQNAAGPAWTENSLGDFLRPMVRLRDMDTERLSLLSVKIREHDSHKALLHSLSKRRLVLVDLDGRARIVHEAVLRQWPEANGWLSREKVTLQRATALSAEAQEWRSEGFAPEFVSSAGPRDAQRAAEVLISWTSILADPDASPSETEVNLRRYGLALLSAHPTPSKKAGTPEPIGEHVHIAAWYGDLPLLKRYLDIHPEAIEARSRHGSTPLLGAAYYDFVDLVAELIHRGADPNAKKNDGWSALHVAAHDGFVEIADLLLKSGADVNLKGPNEYTPLAMAASRGNTTVVARLLAEANIDPQIVTTGKWDALTLAVSERHHDIVARLINDARVLKPQANTTAWRAIHLAARHNQAEVAHLLLEGGVNTASEVESSDGWLPLHRAASVGASDVACILVAAGADPNARTNKGETPTSIAVAHRQFEFVTFLKRLGAHLDVPDEEGHSILHRAAMGLKWHGESDQYQISSAEARIADYLLKTGADLNVRGPKGRTPLHLAARFCVQTVADSLIRGGASVSTQADDGNTPLHEAALAGAQSITQSLLDAGADVKCANADGWTPLHFAALAGSMEIARLLVEHGAAVDAVSTIPPLTPLQAAATTGQTDVCKYLLDNGADLMRYVDGSEPAPLLAMANMQLACARELLARADTRLAKHRGRAQEIITHLQRRACLVTRQKDFVAEEWAALWPDRR